jgi:ubiquinone/menaquinone biosynthesis C-methylase UbiE
MSYKNIAEIYAASRPHYPQELFDLILSKLSKELRDTHLDLGCGTGELLFPLSNYFKNSVGIDPDEDMLRVAADKMKKMNIKNVQLVQSTSENYLTNLPENMTLDLVTAGRSFHWMQQELVAREVYKHLKTDGMFVSLGESDGGIWKRTTPWAQAVHKIIFENFPDKKTFVSAKGHSTSIEIIKNNLHKVPFRTIEDFVLETKQQWNIPMIINLFYSGSGFLDWLGNDKNKFETEVKEALLKINPLGKFESKSKFGITSCRK